MIAQMKGNLTKARYTAAKVYVYHHLELSFVYIHRYQSSNEFF